MNLKDARVQKTRNNIHQVFFKLLKEKPISRITVSEICQQCQINRSTFYKHYADPYDLLEKTEESFLTHLEKEFENRWRNDFDLWMTDILTYMKENRDVYHALDSANGDSALSLKVFLKIYHLIFPDFRSRFPQLSEAEVNMLFQYFTQGCSGVLIFTIRAYFSNRIFSPVDYLTFPFTLMIEFLSILAIMAIVTTHKTNRNVFCCCS